jgi:N-acetylmuramoyl-L-alanine amidase
VWTTPRARGLLVALLILGVAATSAVQPPAASAATNDTIAGLAIVGTPFTPDGDGFRDVAVAHLTLRRSATMKVVVRRPDGVIVRRLAVKEPMAAGTRSWTWDGRNDSGKAVKNGTYRVKAVATNALGKVAVTRDVRKGLPKVFAARPGAIRVAINAGHGGSDPGAIWNGYREADFNLDISLHLQRMLEAAGVKVVMIRSTDTDVNLPPADVNGDGLIDQSDELAARNDIANLARADIYVNPHNNAAPCRCGKGTSVYTNKKRTWSPDGIKLATLVQQHQLSQLAQHASESFKVNDRGVQYRDFYVMRPYELPRVPRPALMPTILPESLFVDSEHDQAVLRQPEARYSIAVAMYLGIAQYFKTRDRGVRYAITDGPGPAVAASATSGFAYRLTNTGRLATSGWHLELRLVPAVAVYDGSGERGELLASVPVANSLAPGARTTLSLNNVTMPPAGEWLVKADIRLSDGSYLSDRGIVSLQVPLTTTP